MSWQVPKIWEGGDAWIIGGGPSLATQFNIPKDVVLGVQNGKLPLSTYSPYMEALHDKHVIGVNVAYMLGDWVDIAFYGDKNFYNRYFASLAVFPGLKITCYPHERSLDWLKYVGMDKNHPRGINRDPTKVSWNKSTGAAAINLAYHTGVNRIFLLGFDMKLDTTSHQHWHDVYNRGAIVDERRIRKLPFARHLRYFPYIVREAKELGLEIINVNPDSGISGFPKVPLSAIL